MAVTATRQTFKPLTGAGQQAEKVAFAAEVLKRVGVPLTSASVQKLVAWENQEGGNWANDAKYNPLNTTLALPGAGNTGSQGNIKVYQSWDQGIEATVKTLTGGSYSGIIAALKSGTAAQFESAVNASPWGTKFPGGGAAVSGSKLATTQSLGQKAGELLKIPAESGRQAEEAGESVGKAANSAVNGWVSEITGFVGKEVITGILLLAGAVLIVYGIMVAVRPRESAFSLPRSVPVPA